MNNDARKAFEKVKMALNKKPGMGPVLATLERELQDPSTLIQNAIEDRNTAMRLNAALVEHVRNFCDDDGASLVELDAFQKAAQHEINFLYESNFGRKAFENGN